LLYFQSGIINEEEDIMLAIEPKLFFIGTTSLPSIFFFSYTINTTMEEQI
jgi:hypothetical protein